MLGDFLLDAIIGPVYRLPAWFIVAKLVMDFMLVRYLYSFKDRNENCALFFDVLFVFDDFFVYGISFLHGFWCNLFYFPSEMFEGSMIASLIFLMFGLWVVTKFFVDNRKIKLFRLVLTIILIPSIVLTLLIRTGKVTPVLTSLAVSVVVLGSLLYLAALSVYTVFFSFHLLLKLVQRQKIERKKRQTEDNS
jgi:hypothetical protein